MSPLPSFLRRPDFKARIRLIRISACALALVACDEAARHTTAPTRAATTQASGGCGSICALLSDSRPVRSAYARPDSANATVDVGETSVSGHANASVTVEMSTDQRLRTELPPEEELVVRVGSVERRLRLRDLEDPVVVATFAKDTTIRIRYQLSTRIRSAIPVTALQLVQRISGAAIITEARRPWIRPSGMRKTITAGTSCSITAPSETVCGSDVTVNPFYVPFSLGGTFQSDPSTGPSSPITITFSRPVRSITVTAIDPTYAGNRIVAYDSAGAELGQVNFAYSGRPGVNSPDTKTLTAPDIRTIVLVPADSDYVAYDASFIGDTCLIVTDSALNSPAVRRGFYDALRASNPDSAPGTGFREEHGGVVWQAPDSSLYTQELTDPNTTECTYTVPTPGAPPIAGSFAVAIYHTHPALNNELVYGCKGAAQAPNDGLPIPKAATDIVSSGGGSPADWASADSQQYPVYVVTKSHRVYRLDPNTNVKDHPKNPNRWELTTDPGCPTKLP